MIKKKLTNTSQITAFKYILSTFIIFISGFMLLRYPEVTGQGIRDGIDLCLGTLIPSLLPFMIISSLAVNLNIFDFFEKIFSKVTYTFFRLPGKSLGVFMLSITGGYPVGGKIIKDLYERGEITAAQSKRLLLSCVNPGPAFVISAVGFYMIGSKKAGIIIYLSVIISSLIICFVTRFIVDDETQYTTNISSNKNKFIISNEFIKSIYSGSNSMLFICAWVILFSAVESIIDILQISQGPKTFINCMLEVTNGCFLASGNLNIPTIACIVGFGGICTHFQIMNAILTIKLKYKYFIISRIVHGALSAVICNFILNFYPVSYDVFSFGTLPSTKLDTSSTALSVCMLTMCALVLLGNTFKLKINHNHRKIPAEKNKKCIQDHSVNTL